MKKKKLDPPENFTSNSVADIGEEVRNIQAQCHELLNKIHEVSVNVVTVEASRDSLAYDLTWLKEQFLEFGDHKDDCEIRSSAEEGRIVEGIECTCGFKELQLQFNSELRR